MNGVEILSSETIYNTILPECWLAIGLGLGFISIVLAVWCFISGQMECASICVIAVICSVIVGSLGGTYSKTDINHIKYKVTIDDSVSMNEFLDKYEILDQEGKIYTAKERE